VLLHGKKITLLYARTFRPGPFPDNLDTPLMFIVRLISPLGNTRSFCFVPYLDFIVSNISFVSKNGQTSVAIAIAVDATTTTTRTSVAQRDREQQRDQQRDQERQQ